jgi:hypothetical protein
VSTWSKLWTGSIFHIMGYPSSKFSTAFVIFMYIWINIKVKFKTSLVFDKNGIFWWVKRRAIRNWKHSRPCVVAISQNNESLKFNDSKGFIRVWLRHCAYFSLFNNMRNLIILGGQKHRFLRHCLKAFTYF